MNEELKNLFDEGYYMVASFDNKGDLSYKNRKFHKYFPAIKNKEDFKELTLSEEIFSIKRKCLVVDSPDMDGIVKFELNYKEGACLFMGLKMNYTELLRLGSYAGMNVNKNIKNLSPSSVRVKTGIYSTMTFDQNWQLRYFSENTTDILGKRDYAGKSLRDIFGETVAEEIISKAHYFKIFDDVTIDMDGKFMVVSELSSGYKVLNVYPYSSATMNKFEELSYLKYKIKKLEKELTDREKFIRAQKEMFKSLTTVDGLTKLYNRRYLIERFSLEMEKITQKGYTFSVINFHIENFKEINVRIGYEKADELLKFLSVIIKKRLQETKDMAFRVGSAEFLVLSSQSCQETAQRQFDGIQEEFTRKTGFDLNVHILDSENLDMNIVGLYHEKR